VIEAIGQGYDGVQTSATYILGAGSEVEVLETTDAAGTTALDLVGNEFDNTIIGNDGTNTIVGSPDTDGGGYDGLDTLTGNGGGDTFVWTSTAETTLAGQDADTVTDFNRVEGDLLAFNQIDADATGGTADDAFTFVGIVDVTAGGSFTGVGQIGYFTADTNGDSVNDMTYILLNTEVDAVTRTRRSAWPARSRSTPAGSYCEVMARLSPRRGAPRGRPAIQGVAKGATTRVAPTL
jgi:hypothetical protein